MRNLRCTPSCRLSAFCSKMFFSFLFLKIDEPFSSVCVEAAHRGLSVPTPLSDSSCRLREEPVGIAGVNARIALDKYMW
jgi:hypothetical protein